MGKKLFYYSITVLLTALLLLSLGLIIWYFFNSSKTTLQDILFYVGAAPIAIFSIGLFGNFVGRGTDSYQLSRSATSQSPNQRAQQDDRDIQSRVSSGINWIAAGSVVWFISYFL